MDKRALPGGRMTAAAVISLTRYVPERNGHSVCLA